MRISQFVRAVGLVTGLVFAASAGAQSYPNKAVRFIVATGPGGTADLLGRIFAAEMSKLLNQVVIVENKIGANQIIALEHISKQSAADGYTVGVIGTDAMALLPFVSKELRFDPFKDLVVVAGLAESRYALTGSVTKPWKNFAELMAYIKANPTKLNYGTSTIQVHFPVMVLAHELKLNMQHIPYSNANQYLPAIAGGTVDMGIIGEGSAASMGDRARVYAITGETRSAKFPDAPTFAELGFPTVRGPAYAVVVRTGTPQAIIDKLSSTTLTALATPEVQNGFSRMYLNTTPDKQDAAVKKFANQVQFYADFSKKMGLKPE